MQITKLAILAALSLQASALPSPGAVKSSLTKRYVPGWCGLHVTQFQRNEGPGADTSVYRLTIELKDANGADIGGVSVAEAPSGVGVDISSALPYIFIATAGYVDSDPVTFAYAGQNFDSATGQCSMGGYQGGSRQGDCGFSC